MREIVSVPSSVPRLLFSSDLVLSLDGTATCSSVVPSSMLRNDESRFQQMCVNTIDGIPQMGEVFTAIAT